MDFQPISKTEDQINSDVESFLDTYHPSSEIPVPIEDIIELQLEMNIITIPGLKDLSAIAGFDIDAFIGSDFKSITVDENIYKNVATRYRFTLAHEIGHMFLHGYLYNQLKFNNTGEWVNIINEMPELERSVVEWQANEFAGLLLVPRRSLQKELESVIKENEERFSGLQGHGVLSRKDAINLAIYPLSHKFKVSDNVIKIRLDNDGLLH